MVEECSTCKAILKALESKEIKEEKPSSEIDWWSILPVVGVLAIPVTILALYYAFQALSQK